MRPKLNNNSYEITYELLIGIIILIPLLIAMYNSGVSIIGVLVLDIIVYATTRIINIRKLETKWELKPTFNEKYYREIPNIKPAILRYFIYGEEPNDNSDFRATILDLINREYISIYKNNENYIIERTDKEEKELCRYERKLLDIIFKKIARKDTVSLEELKELIKQDSISGYRLQEWKASLKVETYRKGSKDYTFINKNKEKHNKKVLKLIIGLICLEFILLIISFNYEINSIFLILHSIILSSLFSVRGIEVVSFTQETVDDIEKAKALKRYIDDYSLMDEHDIDKIGIWKEYLVYACALDSSDKVDELFDKILGKDLYKIGK